MTLPHISGLWIVSGSALGAIRISTVGVMAISLAVGLFREPRWKVLYALVAWFFASEALFQWVAIFEAGARDGHSIAFVADWIVGGGHSIIVRNGLWLFLGPALVALGFALRVPVSWRWVAVLAALWVAWVALGMPTNNDPAHRSALGEVMDTATKTAFAVCYLAPLVRMGLRSRRQWVAKALSFIPGRAA